MDLVSCWLHLALHVFDSVTVYKVGRNRVERVDLLRERGVLVGYLRERELSSMTSSPSTDLV